MNITLEQIHETMTREEFENNLVVYRGDICLCLGDKYICCPNSIVGREAKTCSDFDDDCKECWLYHGRYIKFKINENKEGDKGMFTKKDLKSGMIVKNRKGSFYLVVDGTLIGNDYFDMVEYYKDDLTNKMADTLDIMYVWDITDKNAKYRIVNKLSSVETDLKPVYARSEVDWSKVPVDTKVLVRDFNGKSWARRHFAKFEDGKVFTFNDGMTSFTGDYDKVKVWNKTNVKLYEE